MRLFKYENFRVVVEPEALMLKPFKKIWDRDKSEEKEKASMELAFVYFYTDPRSDYMYLTDEEERKKAIKEGEGFKDKWEPDKTINEAIVLYESFKSSASLLLEDTRFAVDKLRKLLREIDLTATDERGKPIYTLNTITATIKQVPSLIEDLNKAERSLNKEALVEGRMRGSGEKSIYEDGFN